MKWLILLLSLALVTPTYALEKEVRLEDVLASLERFHPLIKAAQLDRQGADGELQAAKGAFDPLLRARGQIAPLGYYKNGQFDLLLEQPTPFWGTSLFLGYRLGLGNFAEYDGKLKTGDQGEIRAGMLVPLWRNGPIDRRRATITRADLGRSVADTNVSQQRIELVRLATQRYFEWVASGQRFVVARDLLNLARTRDSALASRVARGDLPRIERTDNERAIVQREGMVIAARRGLEQAAIELGLYLRGEDGAPRPPLPSQLPASMPDPERLLPSEERIATELRTASDRRPDMQRLRLQYQQAQVERDFASNQRAPAIDLSFSASRDFGVASPTQTPTELAAGIQLDLPLLNRNARGRLTQAEANLAKVQAQSRLAQDRISAEVRDAVSALKAATERLLLVRRERTLAVELERAERTRFNLGESNLLFVNLREQISAETAVREIDAGLDCHRAFAAYQAATALRNKE